MDASDMHTDGNEIAGLLQDVFVPEFTTMERTCQSCGDLNAVGAHRGTTVPASSCGAPTATTLRCGSPSSPTVSSSSSGALGACSTKSEAPAPPDDLAFRRGSKELGVAVVRQETTGIARSSIDTTSASGSRSASTTPGAANPS